MAYTKPVQFQKKKKRIQGTGARIPTFLALIDAFATFVSNPLVLMIDAMPTGRTMQLDI